MGLRNLLTGLGVGAATMYLLDPVAGRARQSRLRDRFVRFHHETEETASLVCRDMSNRTRGLVAELQAMITPDYPNDALLTARVRSELGHVASHVRPLQVDVHQGTVTLRGEAHEDEIEAIDLCVRSVRGVKQVANELQPAPASTTPGQRPNPRRLDLFQRRWSPATRFLVGAGCGAVALSLLRGRAPLTFLAGSLATGLTAVRLAERAGCPQAISELVDRRTSHSSQQSMPQTSSEQHAEQDSAAQQSTQQQKQQTDERRAREIAESR